MILIDSSVWIDSLSAKPTVSKVKFTEIITGGEGATIFPIINEVLSHPNPKLLSVLRDALGGLERIDEDWNSSNTWEQLHEIAIGARQGRLSPLGVVDRMVLLCARETRSTLWTLEHKAVRLAGKLGIKTI